jgi:large subunit ribosomal protein L5
MTTLKQRYNSEIKTKVGESLGITNVNAIPRLVKISINVGLGELKGNEPLQKNMIENLGLITGQQPVPTKAKVSIAGFKLREGDLSGYKVTLRDQRMFDFLDRLITYVFPRLRDFQGMSLKGFDGHGNYSFGLREQSVFPEVPYDQGAKSGGLQVTIATTAQNDESARALLQALGFPFEKKEDK